MGGPAWTENPEWTHERSDSLTRIIHEGEPEMLSPAWTVVEREISTIRRPRRSVRPSDASEREARGAKWVSQ